MSGRSSIAMRTGLAVAALACLAGCGGGGGAGGVPAPNYDEVVTQAWGIFSGGDYAAAEARFEEAAPLDTTRAEAYSGIGWCDARRAHGADAELAASDAAFARGSAKVGEVSAMADLFAGWAFVARAQVQGVDLAADSLRLRASTSRADQALSMSPSWTFGYLAGLDRSDLLVLEAGNHYCLGEYTQSLALVKQVDPSFDADVSTAAGRSALAGRIETLGNSAPVPARPLTRMP